jgi:hypothetical protein
MKNDNDDEKGRAKERERERARKKKEIEELYHVYPTTTDRFIFEHIVIICQLEFDVNLIDERNKNKNEYILCR